MVSGLAEKVQHRFVYSKILGKQICIVEVLWMKHLWDKGNAVSIGKDCMLKTPMGSDISETLKRDNLMVT